MATSITSIRQAPATGSDVRTLDQLVTSVDRIEGIWADALEAGDWVVIRTRNSVYSLAVLGNDRYRVTGGWFKNDPSGVEVGIAGCTWGGAAIHTRVVAAPGMFLEFDNGVRTTRIREATLIRDGRSQKTH
jgi:hypothetical protein